MSKKKKAEGERFKTAEELDMFLRGKIRAKLEQFFNAEYYMCMGCGYTTSEWKRKCPKCGTLLEPLVFLEGEVDA